MHVKLLALFAAGAVAALVAAGCSKGSDQSTTSSTTTTEAASAAPVAPAATSAGSATATSKVAGSAEGDAAHGKTVFASKCAVCHGPTGTEGGAGPSLKNEKSRKNYAQAVAWIKEPLSPMPKLYPDQISAKDVADVAAYVEGL